MPVIDCSCSTQWHVFDLGKRSLQMSRSHSFMGIQSNGHIKQVFQLTDVLPNYTSYIFYSNGQTDEQPNYSCVYLLMQTTRKCVYGCSYSSFLTFHRFFSKFTNSTLSCRKLYKKNHLEFNNNKRPMCPFSRKMMLNTSTTVK